MEHFSTFQYLPHNSEKLSVCVLSVSAFVTTNYTHLCNKWAPRYRNYTLYEIRNWGNTCISSGCSFTLLRIKFILDPKFYNRGIQHKFM